MSSDILKTYYTGVLKRIRAEVDLLNKIIPHNVTKGSQNEEAIKNLIKSFIPKKYSVGSGIIIDSFGNSSKQIDIIIYDSFLYPSLFSQSSTAIYPVETVLGTIEIKTYLDEKQLLSSFENTKSVRKLKHYIDTITVNQPNQENPLKIIQYSTRPPVSFLFAFNSDSQNPETWKGRFNKYTDFADIPEASILLDVATVFRFPDITIKKKESFEVMYYQIRDLDLDTKEDIDEVIFVKDANQSIIIEDNIYKSTNFEKGGNYPVLMPERAFLSFLLSLNKLIEMQPRHLSFDATKYLDEKFCHGQLL